MSVNQQTVRAPKTGIQGWETFLRKFPGCVSVRNSNTDDNIRKICHIFEENEEILGNDNHAIYMEGEDFVAVAKRVDETWLFAHYTRPIELGLLHARIEERITQERIGTKR